MADESYTTFQEFVDGWRGRVLGRVFSHEHALHFVLEVDEYSGVCRVSRRHHGRTEIVHMPLDDVLVRMKADL